MKIVIDLQGAQTESRFRGIGRYSLSLVKAIVRNRGEHDIIIALNGLFPETIMSIRNEFDGLLSNENIRVWFAPGPVDDCVPENITRRMIAETLYSNFIKSLHPDIFFITSLFEDHGVTNIIRKDREQFSLVISLYDLIPLKDPEAYLYPHPHFREFYMRKIDELNNADGLMAISDFSAREGNASLNFSHGQIVNISTACDSIFRKIENPDVSILKRLGISKSFILYTGGCDSRKNLRRLIEAYSILPDDIREYYMLVLAGKMPDGNLSELKHYAGNLKIENDSLLFTGYITDEELVLLYNTCSLFVFPSLHEGFGLPALEAINCGAAVIASNTTSIPEVIGCKNALFDPLNVKDITEKIYIGITNNKFRKNIIEKEAEQIFNFSWEISAHKALMFFENIYNSGRNRKKNTIEHYIFDKKDNINDICRIPNINTLKDVELNRIAKSININHPHNHKNTLYVDLSELIQRDSRTGVQRVTRSIFYQLDNLESSLWNVVPIYAVMDQTGYKRANIKDNDYGNVEFRTHAHDDFVEFHNGDVFLGLDLQHDVTIRQQNYLLFLNNIGVKIYFVVHDLLPVQFPHLFWHGMESLHSKWLDTITNYDGVACVSQTTAFQLAEWMSIHKKNVNKHFNIGWFHNGANIDNSIPSLGLPYNAEKELTQFSSNKSFLMVGTIEPRKRQDQVLEAFECLWNENINVNLIIVGKKGWLTDDLCIKIMKHKENGKRLFWLEGISDEYLEKIYAASTCLIAASEGEGFGLPLIEAAQKKIPIIARDIPVFREVAGNYAYYFSATTGNELAHSIKEWISLYNEDSHPRSDDMPWQTWKESTMQLLKAIGIESEGSGPNGE